MPVPNYSVLKGDPVSGRVVTGVSPHYQITIQTDSGNFTVAVNIQSVDGSEVLYVIDQNFTPPQPGALLQLPNGFTALPSTAGGLALDFVRSTVNGAPMVTKSVMTLLPEVGTDNQLHNAVVGLLNMAIADSNGTLYAFGSSYADSGQVDGIHDIHMNQGNPSPDTYSRDNGIWQDGAVFVNLPATKTWTALFIAFQTESWNTNDLGDPV